MSVSPAQSTRFASSPSQSDVAARQAGAGSQQLPDYPAALRPQAKQATLAERRGTAPKPLPTSVSSRSPNKPPFQGNHQRDSSVAGSQPDANFYTRYHQQQHWPRPQSSSLDRPAPDSSISRFNSTRAERGSPPPTGIPMLGPGQQPDIDARFAATGIARTHTLSNTQSQSFAAQRRAQEYANQQQQQRIQRPWTPTEGPGTQPHGPPTVYQGSGIVTTENRPMATQAPQEPRTPTDLHNRLEQDFEGMHIVSSPPPAYSSLSDTAAPSGFQTEKQRLAASLAQSGAGGVHPAANAPIHTTAAATPTTVSTTVAQDHPVFANNPRQQLPLRSPQTVSQHGQFAHQQIQFCPSPAPSTIPPTSPPPLPEGWIAHPDPNSGQYYYIHLPTQSTQWEFPKGPMPLTLNETPLSPVGSVYSSHALASPAISTFKKPLISPGLPLTPAYESLQSPVMGGFTGLLPNSGVSLYKVVPTNGVYFGPYLRYTNMDLEDGIWLGSILIVTDAAQPPTIHIHQSVDLSPNPRQLKAANIAVHQRWTFYKYDIDLRMEESGPAKWTYAVTSHLGCTRYEFLVAGRYDTNWRFVATSGNDFSLNANVNDRSRLGGASLMWKDILQKHNEIGGFHAQLCLGGQIYADRMWKEIPSLKQWLAMSGKEARKNAPWTTAHEEDVSHAYFHYYTSHFDQSHLRETFAQIPYICQVDDHDIFDGFGSYPEHMQFSNVFKNIGRIGIDMYLLFQHHTTLDILRNVSTDIDLFTITGTGWHFVKYLGPAVAVVGPDCRSERKPHQVMAGPTYQGLFPKVAMLPSSVQHCIWMVSVPLIYPRLESAEQLAQTMATGKRAVTGAYNVLGKVTSSVAGVVGAKEVVGTGFDTVKRAVGKSGLMGGVLSPFGELGLLDELRDQWTHESKDLERTYLIRTLQGIARHKSIRMTFVSGAVDTCGAGLVHDPSHPSDHKTMYQIISSPVVNTPPPSYIVKLFHNSKKLLYLPANGQRSSSSKPTDTKEDMLEVFQTDVNGQPCEHRKLLGRRNYAAIVAYDPEIVNATYGGEDTCSKGGRLSLAVDLMAQGEGAFGNIVKYGPVVIPALEHGN